MGWKHGRMGEWQEEWGGARKDGGIAGGRGCDGRDGGVAGWIGARQVGWGVMRGLGA